MGDTELIHDAIQAPTKADARFPGSFTDRWVNHCKLPTKDSKPNQWAFMEKIAGTADPRSLCLVISYGGRKTWRVVWYEQSRPKSAKIGNYPAMGIKQARQAAAAFNPVKASASKEAGTFRKSPTSS